MKEKLFVFWLFVLIGARVEASSLCLVEFLKAFPPANIPTLYAHNEPYLDVLNAKKEEIEKLILLYSSYPNADSKTVRKVLMDAFEKHEARVLIRNLLPSSVKYLRSADLIATMQIVGMLRHFFMELLVTLNTQIVKQWRKYL